MRTAAPNAMLSITLERGSVIRGPLLRCVTQTTATPWSAAATPPAPSNVQSARGGYLAFLGRISPERRVDRAIKVAQTLGIPLKIAAKVDRTDEVYFREQITPLLKGPGVQFIGETTSIRRVISSAKP
jgi:glycosyltransferase involved in cell wall biosynthesis